MEDKWHLLWGCSVIHIWAGALTEESIGRRLKSKHPVLWPELLSASQWLWFRWPGQLPVCSALLTVEELL